MLLMVSQRYGLVEREEFAERPASSESLIGYKICQVNDLILNKLKAYLGVFFRASISGLVSPDYTVFRAIDNIVVDYFEHLFKTPLYISELNRESKGVVIGFFRLYTPDFYNLFSVFPPIKEQKQIFNYIQLKSVEINHFISNKQRLIELLKEQKTTIINRAVTKGINPHVPMKPSDVEWLGEIPVHWEIQRVKYITNILRGKFTHRPRNDPRMYDGKYPFIQTGDVTSAQKYIKEYHQTLSEEGFAVSKQFPKGTLVMTIAANIGDIAILDFEACFPDSIVGFVPKDFINIDYLYNLFFAMRQELFRVAPINTQFNLNVERIGVLWAVIPPMQDQVKIIQFIETENAKIDEAIAKIEKEIELIQEYRTTLISDAVTGKIDVRETSAVEPTLTAAAI